MNYPRPNANNNPGSEHSSSLISVPVPKENCVCVLRNRSQKRKPDEMLEDRDDSNYEAEFIRQEIEKLSFKEQTLADAAIRGNSHTATTILERQNMDNAGFAEESAFLSLKFNELDRNLQDCISSKLPGFKAYEMARAQDSTYIDDPKFKIGFLRAERYDAQKTAHRIFLNLSEKLTLFGAKTLSRDLLWEDLGDDGQWYHKNGGGFQILPKRDEAGRLIIVALENLQGKLRGRMLGIVSIE